MSCSSGLDKGEVHYAGEVSDSVRQLRRLSRTDHVYFCPDLFLSCYLLLEQATVGALGLLSGDTRIYAARPILISGDCKRETGEEHSEMLATVLESVDSLKADTHLRTVSIASDGETRRGSAFVILTFKYPLPTTSPIYPLLKPLVFMNLHVGEDDITCDKDWKHVFKRARNLILRARGIVVDDIRITPSVIEAHFKMANHTAAHIHALFNPDDHQDVKLAFDMLKDLWALQSLSEHVNPSALETREALRTLGKLLWHLVFPYLCVELSLSEQLEHLSAAAHLCLALYHKHGTKFLPSLLYTDIMIMIKNVWFCVAKMKVDNSKGSFYLMLLGTDRLEKLFGILRTMIGNDANLDIYQLASRLTGTTQACISSFTTHTQSIFTIIYNNQVSNILAKYPHWDRPPRRLKLPAITRDSKELPDTTDHIKPSSWKGDVCVSSVSLLTCWRRGRHLVETEFPATVSLFKMLEKTPGIDMLSPHGKLLVTLPAEPDDSVECIPFNTNTCLPQPSAPAPDIPPNEIAVEIEDAILGEDEAESEPNANVAPTSRTVEQWILYGGKKMLKSRAVSLRSKLKRNPIPSSTDRLKRVQAIERYSAAKAMTADFDSTASGDLLIVHDPVATLVRCSEQIFLCIGEVNAIKVDSDLHSSIPVEDLADGDKVRYFATTVIRCVFFTDHWYYNMKVTISIRVFGLRPAAAEDDPSLKNDWKSYQLPELTLQIPSKWIYPINPSLVPRSPTTRQFYLFQGSFLVALAASIFSNVTNLNVKELVRVTATSEFPYREASGIFFVYSCVLCFF